MSSSSSDSDSDELEPIRKIKINIRPKEDLNQKKAADVSVIKASVDAWRPLGPPTHPSLSRRQSSLSSVSSMFIATNPNAQSGSGSINFAKSSNVAFASQSSAAGLQSSPSCISLVNDFNNRSSFSNFIPATMSRTSSPSMHLNQADTIPIAIAIQESIDFIIKGIYDPNAIEPVFHSRLMGNIKIAFPNAFAKLVACGNNPVNPLRLGLESTDSITKYYASRLIRDLDIETNGKANTVNSSLCALEKDVTPILSPEGKSKNSSPGDLSTRDAIGSDTNIRPASKHVDFDMQALSGHLRKMHEQSPTSRYYNVDVLRYQITPFKSIDDCPLLACAYWKIDIDVIKLRIDFGQSTKNGLNLDNLREIHFMVSFASFLPPGTHDVDSGYNNNNSGTLDMNELKASSSRTRLSNNSFLRPAYAPVMDRSGDGYDLLDASCSYSTTPLITHEPQATWNNSIKQLTWKFDSLLSDGVNSLFAKLDFRQCKAILPQDFLLDKRPAPVDIKFLLVESTLSKMAINVESTSYKLSFLKKETRSGRFKVEPYIF